ncbi:hypothetical protein AMR41_27765 [Hapalosiphon sp. MRB220]|nr:hypothetical protein AMR41_27765 [Hapalosiphon sp. MRB220]
MAVLIPFSNHRQKDAGFTLLEVLVVVFLIGILSAIVAPGWLGFVNRQQLNKASDAVVLALRQAQAEAKRNKLNYSVSFRTNNNIPEISVHSGSTPTNWRPLQDIGQSGKVILGMNLTSTNTAGTSVAFNNSTTQTITFDYIGALPNANFGIPPSGSTEQPGLRIVVATPSGSSTSPSNAKACVIVQTLLGTMRQAKNTQC